MSERFGTRTLGHVPRRSKRRLLLASIAISLVVLPSALAASIVGTSGSDRINGTSAADRISARAGNDKIYGLGGNDVLDGGPGQDYMDGGNGSDRILVRDSQRDTVTCGQGRDTVVADRIDAVRSGCETVLKPPTPPPPAPPPSLLLLLLRCHRRHHHHRRRGWKLPPVVSVGVHLPPPPDLDCGDISFRNFSVRHDVPNPDPHRFDGNKDGVGCET